MAKAKSLSCSLFFTFLVLCLTGAVAYSQLFLHSAYRLEVLTKVLPELALEGQKAEIGRIALPEARRVGQAAGSAANPGHSYVWALAKQDSRVWFGTIDAAACLEMTLGAGGSSSPVPGQLHPPRVYYYDTTTKATHEASVPPGADAARLESTTGFRSAGSLNNVVILAGPALSPAGSVNIFAFKSSTGEFLGSRNFPLYHDIRTWTEVEGVLYAGAGRSGPGGGGAVLRWVGDAANPLLFREVGQMAAEPAYLAPHHGRLFATTRGGYAALYMSPSLPRNGLGERENVRWKKVWSATDYEPDPFMADFYEGGALASFDGYLYWGTTHVPGNALVEAMREFDFDADDNGRIDADELATAYLGTSRPIAIFRGKDLDSHKRVIELLYGEKQLPVFEPDLRTFVNKMNLMPNPSPRWGRSGFGSHFNTFTWSMAVYNRTLFIGTFDWRHLFTKDALASILGEVSPALADEAREKILSSVGYQTGGYAVDLWRVTSSSGPALAEPKGAGSHASPGVRTMLVDRAAGKERALYLGSASPVSPSTEVGREPAEESWELIRLTPMRK